MADRAAPAAIVRSRARRCRWSRRRRNRRRCAPAASDRFAQDRKSTRLNSSHLVSSYAVFCLTKTSGGDQACQRESHGGDDSQGQQERPGQAGGVLPRFRGGFPGQVDPGRFFFNDPATTEIYTLSLHDALPISSTTRGWRVAKGLRQHYVVEGVIRVDRKSTRLNSSHLVISYAVFCLKKKK